MIDLEYKNFIKKLKRVRRYRHFGLLLGEVLNSLCLLLIMMAVYCILDRMIGLTEGFRLWAGPVILVVIAVFLVIRVGLIAAESLEHSAGIADEIAGSRRKDILSAYELGKAVSVNNNEMSHYLISRQIADADKIIDTLSFSMCFPLKRIRKYLPLLFAVICVAAVLFGINPEAARIVIKRIVFPRRDIPPYSRLRFSVTPEHPKVVYGENVEISVKITSGKTRSRVMFVTRTLGGKQREFSCFREGADKFVHRLEKLTEPVFFCFKTGRTRSHWHKVELLLQPRISLVRAKITPPAYSRLTAREYVGGEAIKELAGSQAVLTITSNRPLSKGTLTIKPIAEDENTETIKGTKNSLHSIQFNWKIKTPAKLYFTVSDILGTRCKDPLLIRQQIRLDNPPVISVSSPDNFIMATPGSNIKLSASFDDDLGLKHVDMIRALQGYRDRVKNLEIGNDDRSFFYESQLNLKALGVAPGQDIEFYFEAFDFNPSLTGSSTSDFIRIKVISEKEYARMLRERSTIRELSNRYNYYGNKHFVYQKALLELRKLVETKASRKMLEAGLEKLQKTANAAVKALEMLTKDFAIYDIEKKHRKVLEDILKRMKGETAIVNSMSAEDKPEELLKKLDSLQHKADAVSSTMKQLKSESEQLAWMEKFMAETVKFNNLVKDQKFLVKRLSIFKSDAKADRVATLPKRGEKQREIIANMEKILMAMRSSSSHLTGKHRNTHAGVLAFIEMINKFEIPKLMNSCAENCKYKNGSKAYDSASLALERLEELLQSNKNKPNSQKNPVVSMCNGECPGGGNLDKTLQQMLQSMMSRGTGNASGSGGGGGGGGDMNDGYIGNGSSPLNVPVVGPDRKSFSDRDGTKRSTRSANNRGNGQGMSGSGSGRIIPREYVRPENTSDNTSGAVNLDEVPEQYRQAVKKYFGGGK